MEAELSRAEWVRIAGEVGTELVRLVGEPCACAVMNRTIVFAAVARRPEPKKILHSRPRGEMRADLQQIARMASTLADLLYAKDTRVMLAREVTRSRSVDPSYGPLYREAIAEASHELKGLPGRLRTLAGWAQAAFEAAPRTKGPAPRALPAVFVQSVAQALAMWGHPLSTAENGKLVRVLRIVWARTDFQGDPRDVLRRFVKSGLLPLKEIEGAARARLAEIGDPGAKKLAGDWFARMAVRGAGGECPPPAADHAPGGE